MKRLLFDARQNPGGPLDQAIKVANSFLPKGKMVVYTRGRISNSDQDYRAADEGEFQNIPVVMLVNRNSASASEIVSGALQDHDRAYLVGETTFGKALVQSVYRIANDAGLALTTAHYFTPSGTADSTAVGLVVRRVPQLRVDGTGREQAAQRERPEAHRGWPPGLQRRRRRARPPHCRARIEGFNPTPFGRLLVGAAGVRELRPEVHGRRRHAHRSAGDWPPARRAELQRRRRDVDRLPRAPRRRAASRSTRRRSRRT